MALSPLKGLLQGLQFFTTFSLARLLKNAWYILDEQVKNMRIQPQNHKNPTTKKYGNDFIFAGGGAVKIS